MTDSPSAKDRPTNMWEELNRPKPRNEKAAPESESEDRGAGFSIGAVLGGAMAIVAVAAAGFIVMGGGEPVPVPTTVATEPTEELALFDEPVDSTVEEGEAIETPVDEVAGEEGEGEEAVESDVYSPAVPAGAAGNYVILSRGKLYLRGEMPSPLHVAGVVTALEELMGPGNVISEYVVDPEAEFEMGRPSDVFIEDTVLFAFGSSEIAPDFYPLLGLGLTLMQMQETVTIEVYGHTDSVGDADTNQALSQARVDAVKAFYMSQGIDPSRVIVEGRGESDPVANNDTADGRQLNRRVEIIVNGFIFSL